MESLESDNFKTILKARCICLTGGIATGKSFVGHYLRHLGYMCFDADQLARTAVTKGKPALENIKNVFGLDVLRPDGSLDRLMLRRLITTDKSAKNDLEAIMHPAIFNEFKLAYAAEAPRNQNHQIFFYEAPVIHEVKRGSDFLEVWCTLCTQETQIKRLMGRDKNLVTIDDAMALIRVQMPADEKARLSTRVIDTNGSEESVKLQLQHFLKDL
ncbi:MAG: dephospho-CoA kinase [Proteobacteria bacterium]|nr:dephospho-CoA kinase [Pseudomonadota bacterium]